MYFKYTNKLNYETNNYAIIMLKGIIEKNKSAIFAIQKVRGKSKKPKEFNSK